MIEAVSNSISPIKCSKKGNIYEGTNSSKILFPVAGLAFAAPTLKDVFKSSKEAKVANVIYTGLQIALVNIGLGAIVDGLCNWHRSKGADASMEIMNELVSVAQKDCLCECDDCCEEVSEEL